MSIATNRRRAQEVFDRLGSLGSKAVVFGATSPSLHTLAPGIEVRVTDDVDLLFDCPMHMLSRELAACGFTADRLSHTMTRYKYRELLIDAVPIDGTLGSNRWLVDAYEGSAASDFDPRIRVVSPLAFLVLKFEAYADPKREFHGDPRASRDVEDIVLALRALPELLPEIRTGKTAMHHEARQQLERMLDEDDWIEGHLERDRASQDRAKDLEQRIRLAVGKS